MSDRFKFRAWDKVRGQYEDCKVYLNTNGKLIGFYGRDERLDGFYIVEQCTGLKDKNGKLIFEGDVVHYVKHTNMGIGGDRCATVFWWEAVQGFAIETTYGDYYGLQDYELEVIGNIHENAELLNEND